MRTTLAITHVAFEDLGSLGIELTQAGFNIQLTDACTTNLRAIDALDCDLALKKGTKHKWLGSCNQQKEVSRRATPDARERIPTRAV
jgi:hypothetical protein